MPASTEDKVFQSTAPVAGESLVLGSGDDGYQSTNNHDTVDGAGGNDTIDGGDGDDLLLGGDQNDVLIGDEAGRETPIMDSDDTLIGGDGDDHLIGGIGRDSLVAGSGNDSLFGGREADTLIGGSDGSYLVGGQHSDWIYTDIGSDTICYDSYNELSGIDQIYGFDANGQDRIDLGLLFQQIEAVETTAGPASYLFEEADDGHYLLSIGWTNTDGSGAYILIAEFYDWTGILDDNDIVTITAQSGDDNLVATGDYNELFGYAGNDTLTGNDGFNTLIGGRGSDLIVSGNQADSLAGGSGDDWIEAGGGNDTIRGGQGYDTITAGAGNDLIIIGYADVNIFISGFNDTDLLTDFQADGQDKIDLSEIFDVLNNRGYPIDRRVGSFSFQIYENNGVHELTLSDGTSYFLVAQIIVSTGTLDQSDFIVSQGQYLGGDQDDLFTGDDRNQFILTYGGNDTIDGAEGDDTIYGGNDNDYISGGGGNDVIDGEQGNDTLIAGDQEDWLQGGAGADSLVGSVDATSFLDGGTGVDTLIGGTGDDFYYIDDISDRIIDAGGVDYVNATLASYTLSADLEHLSIFGDAATTVLGVGNACDNMISGGSTTASDHLIGEDGADTLYGQAGADTLDGGTGNDYLDGGFADYGIGNDSMIGGSGDDTFIFRHQDNRIREEAGTESGYDIVVLNYRIPGPGIDPGLYFDLNVLAGLFTNIEQFELGAIAGAATMIGTAQADNFVGNRNDNLLSGNVGNDTLDGGAGNDTLIGGGGSDTYYVDSYNDFIEDLANDMVSGDIDTVISDLSISINSGVLSLDPVTGQTSGITVGGFANQTAFDVIENLVLAGTATGAIGNGLNNVITGNDVGNNIFAGGGNDTVNGGLGLDTLIGELGNDYLNGQGDTDLLYGNGGQDTLLGEGGDDSAVGGGGNDWLEGGIGQDDLRGNNNNDTLLGGDDNDLLSGGFANDLLVGDAMADTLSAVGGDDVLLAGYGNDMVYGGGGSDSITGGAGNDWLHGGAGNDWFFNTAGGQRLSGVDTLIGGAGDDTLNLQPLSWGRQVVSFDDIVTVVNGQNVIQGVDRVNNFQGDLIDSSGQVINVGGIPVRGPAQNLADQLDLGGLFDQLGYAATAEARQGALDMRPTATTGLFEIWVDVNATAAEDFQMIARVQVTSGTIDLTENIILL